MATKKKPKPRKMSQAALETLVRFQPQFQALDQLANQAKGLSASTIKQSGTVADSVTAAVQAQRAPLAKVYDDSLAPVKTAQSLLGNDLSALSGPGVDVFKGAQATEGAQAIAGLGDARAAALQGLTDRITQARAGQQQAVLAARSKLGTDLADIGSKRLDLANQAGTFEAATTGQLYQKSRDRSVKLQGQRSTAQQRELDRAAGLLKAGYDANGNIIPGGKADPAAKPGTLPNGQKLASGEAHRAAQSVINSYARQVASIVRHGMQPGEHPQTRQQLATLLSNGLDPIKSKPVFDPKTGKKVLNPDGTQATTSDDPGFKAVPSEYQAFIPAILDLVYDGHISPGTARILHGAQLSVRQLGYPGRGTAKSPYMVDVKKARARAAAEAKRNRKAAAAFGLSKFGG